MKAFNLPTKAYVNKFLPKTKIFEKAQVTSKVQQEFTEGISRITWAYKLAENTINISGTENIEEFQIFNIQLKKQEIPKNAIKTIDKAIPFAILYVFEFDNNFSYGITTKDNAEQRYFFSEWNKELVFDFTGNTIEHIYKKTIKLFIETKTGLNANNQEYETLLLKEKQISILEREVIALQKKVRTEKQFNKQVAFNKTLKSKLKELENIKNNTNA